MATTRKPADPPELSAEERTAFDQYVTELSQLGTPPAPTTAPGAPKPVTDAQWDAMTDRARESWVRQLVDARLDDLSREDEAARLAADVAKLKESKAAETERAPADPPPSALRKLQKWLWGEPKE